MAQGIAGQQNEQEFVPEVEHGGEWSGGAGLRTLGGSEARSFELGKCGAAIVGVKGCALRLPSPVFAF